MTAQNDRINHLAALLWQAATSGLGDLSRNLELMEAIKSALQVAPSEQPLERELHELLSRTTHSADTAVDWYAVDRAVAEAEGIVGPGGAIEYQRRWQRPDGQWSEWRTYRTRWSQEPVEPP